MARLTDIRLVLFYAALLCCQAATAVPLWEITGTQNRILLLGSVHYLRAADYPLPAAVETAYRQSDIIVMEIAMDRIDPQVLQQAFMSRAIDPEQRTLPMLIGAENWHKAQSLAAVIDIELDPMLAFEPWFAALQIAQLRLLQLGFDGTHGIETHVTRQANQDSKPILGLESIDDQLETLDELPPYLQSEFLMQTLEEAISIGSDLDSVVLAWKQGDSKQLEALLLAGLAEQPEIYERVLVQRNRNWAEKIEGMVNDGNNYLIVVGALHLIGDDSVQKLLAEAGIETRQIK